MRTQQSWMHDTHTMQKALKIGFAAGKDVAAISQLVHEPGWLHTYLEETRLHSLHAALHSLEQKDGNGHI